MKAFYVTDRAAIGDSRFLQVLGSLRAAPGLAVSLREKSATDREALDWIGKTRERLGPDVPVYVHRRFDLAAAGGAYGVQLPAAGVPLARLRANSPRWLRIGVSTHSVDEARDALSEGADLVLLGPIYETPSKSGMGAPLGPEALLGLPPKQGRTAEVYAIGGIDEERLDELQLCSDRIDGVAGIRIFQESADPRATVARIGAVSPDAPSSAGAAP